MYPFCEAILQRSRAGLYSSDIVQARDVRLEVSTFISALQLLTSNFKFLCAAEVTVIKKGEG
jgi:hypothetical protein